MTITHILASGIVAGAQGKSFESRCGAALGERAEHDDGQPGIGFPDGHERIQSGHPGHFDIQSDQIGVKQTDFGKCDAPVRGGSSDFNIGIGGKGLRKAPCE
jgi:hypothetical protein